MRRQRLGRLGRWTAHAAAAEQFLEFALQALELLLYAVFLLFEGLETDLERVDFLLEVVCCCVVVRFDEQFADVSIHRGVLVDGIEFVEGVFGLGEARFGFLLLDGDFLGGFLQVLKLFDFLLCLWRQIALHISTVALRTDKAKLCRSSADCLRGGICVRRTRANGLEAGTRRGCDVRCVY